LAVVGDYLRGETSFRAFLRDFEGEVERPVFEDALDL
jgi:hypothetical protein